MITAGVDMGAKTIKIVILKDKKIIGKSMILGGFDQRASAEKAFAEALAAAKISRNDIERITVTGIGKKEVYMHPPISADQEVTEVTADSRGAVTLFPSARTVVDVGAEEGRGIKCDATGKVIDFAVNEKCAAGAGSFTEAMARALEVKTEEIGNLSMQSQQAVAMNAQCAVFAESEVVSLVHAKTPKADIARAVHDAIASRITSMVRRIGIEKDVVLIGGVSRNKGFVESLKKSLEVENLLIPEEPEYVGALGAAVMAAENK
ncbi:MAG: CoA activase [Planctomycetes bacterium]|nr:CoA activase [Planctomycetota bacterium]